MAWEDLSMSQRADLIKTGVKYGLRDIVSIRKTYIQCRIRHH
jgi:hypothetical protein